MTGFSSRRLALVTALTLALTFTLGLATLAATLGPVAWPLELFANFRPQLAVFSAAALVLALVLRHRPLIVVLLVLLAANVQPIFSHLMYYVRQPAAAAVTVGQPLRLLSLNMHGGTTSSEKLLALIAAERPDVVLLSEVPWDLAKRMAPLADAYPHQVIHENSQPYDLALFSKLPIATIETSRAGAEYPVLAVDLCPPSGTRGSCVRVVGLHGLSPFGKKDADIHERQIELAARAAAMHIGPAIVMGDMNMTPWSSPFKRLVDNAHLQDTSVLRGLTPTWRPVYNPGLSAFGPLFDLPIDQALVTQDITPRASHVGPDVGSDHRPIIVDVTLPDLSAPNLQ